MRKLYISIPFGKHLLAWMMYEYIAKVNENCNDAEEFKMKTIADLNKGEMVKHTDQHMFYVDQRLVCIVKQIEVNLQEFPQVPNATITN
jgi:hypothetical protein